MLASEADTRLTLDALVARAGLDPVSAPSRICPTATPSATSPRPTKGPPRSRSPATCTRSPSSSARPSTPTIAALVGHLGADRVAGEARELDFTPWGGAYNRVPADATAFLHRAERFLLKHEVVVAADQARR